MLTVTCPCCGVAAEETELTYGHEAHLKRFCGGAPALAEPCISFGRKISFHAAGADCRKGNIILLTRRCASAMQKGRPSTPQCHPTSRGGQALRPRLLLIRHAQPM